MNIQTGHKTCNTSLRHLLDYTGDRRSPIQLINRSYKTLADVIIQTVFFKLLLKKNKKKTQKKQQGPSPILSYRG